MHAYQVKKPSHKCSRQGRSKSPENRSSLQIFQWPSLPLESRRFALSSAAYLRATQSAGQLNRSIESTMMRKNACVPASASMHVDARHSPLYFGTHTEGAGKAFAPRATDVLFAAQAAGRLASVTIAAPISFHIRVLSPQNIMSESSVHRTSWPMT